MLNHRSDLLDLPYDLLLGLLRYRHPRLYISYVAIAFHQSIPLVKGHKDMSYLALLGQLLRK